MLVTKPCNMKFLISIIVLASLAKLSFCQTEIINTNTTEVLNTLSIIDNSVMVGGKGTYIGKSSSECDNFSLINSPANQGAWSEIHRVDTSNIYIFSRSGAYTIIYKSTDGGNSWNEKLNTDTVIGEEFHMFDNMEGILLCFAGKCLRTIDGGNTWTKEYGLAFTHSAIEAIGDSIVAGEGEGAIFSSKNRGRTWTHTATIGNYHRNLFFLDSNTLFSLSSNNIHEYFSFTTNFGTNWATRDLPSGFNAYDTYFLSLNEGYVVGSGGTILKTTDTGLTWTAYYTPTQNALTRIEFLNDSIALIAGTNGTLMKWNKHSWATEIINIEKEEDFTIYPNPVTNTLYINNSSNENYQINIYDVIGNEMFASEKLFSNKIEINTSSFTRGTFFYIIITQGGKMYSGKLLKE